MYLLTPTSTIHSTVFGSTGLLDLIGSDHVMLDLIGSDHVMVDPHGFDNVILDLTI